MAFARSVPGTDRYQLMRLRRRSVWPLFGVTPVRAHRWTNTDLESSGRVSAPTLGWGAVQRWAGLIPLWSAPAGFRKLSLWFPSRYRRPHGRGLADSRSGRWSGAHRR